jgi:hypothetical protein
MEDNTKSFFVSKLLEGLKRKNPKKSDLRNPCIRKICYIFNNVMKGNRPFIMQVVQDSTAELYVFQVLEAKDDFNSKFTSASKVTTGGLLEK